ncbi:FAD-binding oxidoreductase [Salinimicrobium sp. MT39]|uniref:FAD-binding oxidoreductase n=1 Tax=Salinimicrobium profundisediminis TaxID=2994553 RepID=A0A9X3CV46_9FLAO|nr:FAD-binding oxidoreductase [Salinimicrobium profundisediminis]MCX2837256.1 FAD-binding oxidoreductase [Salinimicrobium profundisediminis]
MKDYIIVGAGLSGTCLAYRLEKAGKSFVVFDDDSQEASKVAGGFMNPVILKRFTLAWKADEQLEKAYTFYKDMEAHLKKTFLGPLEVYRRFSSIEEQNNWFAAADKPKIAPFLDTKLVASVNKHIPGKFSFGKVLKTSRIDPRYLLESYSEHLQEKGWLVQETFDHDALQLTTSGVQYKNIGAKKVIFCEGFGIQKNSYFSYLPLRGNKGEYIIIKAPGLDLEVGVKSSIFIFPAGGDHYAVGATYSNTDKTPEPTQAAREELVEKLKDLIKTDFEVVDQVAGLRPSTIDRRPMVGQHPDHKNLYTCNGFGSRGILIAPSISEELIDFIEEGKELDPEIDISRFTRKWYKKA